MDREELLDRINNGSSRARMSDGTECDVSSKPEFWSLNSIGLNLMQRGEDGKLRMSILPLVTMTAAYYVEMA